jgi:hypothetical protein
MRCQWGDPLCQLVSLFVHKARDLNHSLAYGIAEAKSAPLVVECIAVNFFGLLSSRLRVLLPHALSVCRQRWVEERESARARFPDGNASALRMGQADTLFVWFLHCVKNTLEYVHSRRVLRTVPANWTGMTSIIHAAARGCAGSHLHLSHRMRARPGWTSIVRSVHGTYVLVALPDADRYETGGGEGEANSRERAKGGGERPGDLYPFMLL